MSSPFGHREALRLNAGRWLVVVAALLAVEAAVKAGWINPLFVAPPSRTLLRLGRDLTGGEIWMLTWITLCETGIAFLFSVVVGTAAGYLLWRIPALGRAFEPLIAGLFSSPIILLYPIFLVLFGRTPVAVIAQAVTLGILPIVLFTRQAFLGVSPILLKVGRSLDLSPRAIFRHILLPAAAPTVFTGMRLGLTYMLISVVAMEYIVQVGGLGKAVAQSYLRFRMEEVYSGVALVLGISACLIHLTYRAERSARR